MSQRADDDETHGDDQAWADRLGPSRRQVVTAGLVALTLTRAGRAQAAVAGSEETSAKPPVGVTPAHPAGRSPWGYETYREATPRPTSQRPGEQTLPVRPRKYTDIESYHAHVYFDEDNYEKAALIRKWVAERFLVELGNWNLKPRGPHTTPSFYFGFGVELLPVLVPWLQLNSLGLTILLHPNTDDPRSDHLYYALWVNRSQPVNAFDMAKPGPGEPAVEQIYPNTKPKLKLET